jgi:hypothetical protein
LFGLDIGLWEPGFADAGVERGPQGIEVYSCGIAILTSQRVSVQCCGESS